MYPRLKILIQGLMLASIVYSLLHFEIVFVNFTNKCVFFYVNIIDFMCYIFVVVPSLLMAEMFIGFMISMCQSYHKCLIKRSRGNAFSVFFCISLFYTDIIGCLFEKCIFYEIKLFCKLHKENVMIYSLFLKRFL